MHPRILAAALCAVALVQPAIAGAQSNGTQNYYTPPKLVKPAQPSVPVAGAGTVVVQVFVKADGSFTVSKILRSTNHGDDAAALDVAKHGTYAPAKRGTKTVAAFYDYTLRFSANGAAAADAAAPVGLAAFEREIHAGNYNGAQTGLKAYVAQHPDDAKAEADLGAADTYLNDYGDAVAAFDKAGAIDETSKAIAAKAYAEYAQSELKSKENDKAVAAAKRAAELAPAFSTFNTLGYAEFVAADYPASVTDLEKARSLGQSENAKPHDRAQVDDNLMSAYYADGKPDQAKTIFAEVTQLDPSDTNSQSIVASSMAKSAAALQVAGKPADAAALYEQAASVAPSQAVSLYDNAAFAYLAMKTPANDKAKADADKSLAINPSDGEANFAEGVALANGGKSKEALDYFNKASAAAKEANNSSLSAAVDRAIKQLGDTK